MNRAKVVIVSHKGGITIDVVGFKGTDCDAGTGTITMRPAVVTPVISLESPHIGGPVLFEATSSTTRKTKVLLSSTDLTIWLPVSTNAAASASITFTNAADLGQSFYLVVRTALSWQL